MQIETGENLVRKLRLHCDKLQKRLWIASPFIGDINSVRKVLGRQWLDNARIDVRLIIDMDNNSINPITIKRFFDIGKIKSIKGLHAKIYVIDDITLLTSANLTNTAFSKRYEVGIFLSKSESKPLISLYENWWKKLTKNIPPDWTPKITKLRLTKEDEETGSGRLDTIWKLPSDPGDPNDKLMSIFRNYELFLRSYEDFALRYQKIQHLWHGTPLYFEVDSFLNYLFHEAKGRPSNKYKKIKSRILSEEEKIEEIKRYADIYKKWLESPPKDDEDFRDDKNWRVDSSKIINRILSKRNISKIAKPDIKKVVDRFNCMNSLPLNKARFLNSKNNKIDTIRRAWKFLLYDESTPLQIRLNECKNNLQFFGNSSIGELLGYFNPNKYPLRNSNSIAGLRFFGYNVPLN